MISNLAFWLSSEVNRYIIHNAYCKIAYAFLAHSPSRVLRPYIDRFLRNSSLLDQLLRDPVPFSNMLLPKKKTKKLRSKDKIYIATLSAAAYGRCIPAHEQDALPIVASGLRRTPFHPPANDRALCRPDVACITNVTRES